MRPPESITPNPLGAVAAAHPLTAQAATDMLVQGGNAYDAILAGLFMSFVCEPQLSSPGGGGFLLAVPSAEEAKILDFFSNTPLQKYQSQNIDFYPIKGQFSDTVQEFHIGHAAGAVPGMAAGIFAIHEKYATRSLSEIATTAIVAARIGVKVNEQQAYVSRILKPVINASQEGQHLYGKMNSGSVFKSLQLSTFMDNLSRNASDWFYQGTPALAICKQHNEQGGLLTKEDFANYRVIERKPETLSLDAFSILSNPLPSIGGQLITQQLKHQGLNNLSISTTLAAMKSASILADSSQRKSIRGTSHISVSDAHGNLASLTISNGEGNGHVVPDCGFMLNNFLGEEDINPAGFLNWTCGERMSSMMAPTAVIGKNMRMCLGSGGSNRIKTALFQAIAKIMHGSTLAQAINSPRIHFEKEHCEIEPGFKQEDIEYLKEHCQSHTLWESKSLFFGGINGVQNQPYTAAYGDPRRQGCGIVTSAAKKLLRCSHSVTKLQ